MDTSLLIDDDSLIFGVPFVKIDVKNRTVEGFATLDNEDKTGDIVDSEASQRAFAAWPGNIREMHQKIAVGKAVAVLEKDFTDKDGVTYHGFWVKARISKGAEDTWQKVLDGTLTGFSVGGAILEKKQELSKVSGRSVGRITNYRLTELSLVDNPANQLAVISLVKTVEGGVIMADILDQEIDDEYEELVKAKYSDEQRKDMEDKGEAMPGGRYPIHDEEDLKNAIKDARTRAKASAGSDVLAHIKARAKALGSEDLLKDDGEEEPMAKAVDGSEPIKGKHEPTDHLDQAYQHVQSYADHVRQGDHPNKDDHAAHAIDTAGHIARLKRSAQYQAAPDAAPMQHPMAKDGDGILTDNEETDNSVLDISDEEKGIFRKFIDFVKGVDDSKSEEVTDEVASEEEELNKDQGGDTPEMDREELKTVLGEVLGDLSKSVDEKFEEVGGSFKTVEERLASLVTTEVVEALNKSLEEVVGRVAALENSGALKKSADAAAGPQEEKLEKSDSGFWSENIVPSFLKKNAGN